MPTKDLPTIIAGPMLRHLSYELVTLWLVSSHKQNLKPMLFDAQGKELAIDEEKSEHFQYCLGKQCFVHLLRIVPLEPLCSPSQYAYDILFSKENDTSLHLNSLLPNLFNEQLNGIPFDFNTQLKNVLHGSCRKAHFDGDDALPRIRDLLSLPKADSRPDLLLLTGDQVYVDDVAGPMLYAIHQVIKLLGLHHESFESSLIDNSNELSEHAFSFYQREKLFPAIEKNEALTDAFIKGKRKPVFTSVNAHNHLIALNEMIALYLLSWSSRLWPLIKLENSALQSEHHERYEHEKMLIERFCAGLHDAEEVFAKIPTYMIFDDHDVTDDWNLTRGWEEQVYGNAFSRKIIGNALSAYFLCQGLGNPFTHIRSLAEQATDVFTESGIENQNAFIDALFDFDKWHYHLDTFPPVHVLDTRTQRWRSESNKNKPSGLMDWEKLCELQHELIGKDAVIMVSAAPVYGVKFIEAVQRIFTSFGGALMVDAENWMAHRGTASVMLNMFRHSKTPPNFIILSGDVHYSFVYDVSLRFRRNSPKILQFTCSGLHNEFPDKLLRWFERLNRWFYGHRSPLNWLTKRRNMSVRQRSPEDSERDVVNACSFGLLELDNNGKEKACKVIYANGKQVVFKPDESA